MERITKSRLDHRINILNQMLRLPATAYTKQEDGSLKQNEGHIYIQSVYNGYAIEQMCASGSRNVRERIFTARECWEVLGGMIEGVYMVSKYFDIVTKEQTPNV
jgi:hypothetical protein